MKDTPEVSPAETPSAPPPPARPLFRAQIIFEECADGEMQISRSSNGPECNIGLVTPTDVEEAWNSPKTARIPQAAALYACTLGYLGKYGVFQPVIAADVTEVARG